MSHRFIKLKVNIASIIAATLLGAACGGGGSSSSVTVQTPVQVVSGALENLSINLPPSVDLLDSVTFATSATNSTNLKFTWDFGDGKTSSEVSPTHQYTNTGEFEVRLIAVDLNSQSKEVKTKIMVNNQTSVRGLECSGLAETGWCWQAPKPTGNTVKDFTFVSSNTGWRVGEAGDIFKTTNGGKSWIRQRSVSDDLKEVKFFDERAGWARGFGNDLINTQDGGITWTFVKGPERKWFGKLHVLSAKSVLLELEADKYLTLDGGHTWRNALLYGTSARTQGGIYYLLINGQLFKYNQLIKDEKPVFDYKDANGQGLSYASLVLIGEKTIILLGKMPDIWNSGTNSFTNGKSLAWRSDNAGLNWMPMPIITPAPSPYNSITIFPLDSSGTALISTVDGRDYRSVDAGTTWVEIVPRITDYNSFSESPIIMGSRIFIRKAEGYIVSDDIGKTWRTATLPKELIVSYNFNSVMSQSGEILILKDFDRGSFISADRGDTWTKVVSDPVDLMRQSHTVSFFDARNGMLINNYGELQSTNDGGRSWVIRNKNFTAPIGDLIRFNLIQFVDAKFGFALLQDGNIYKSTDGGETWLASANSMQWTQFGFSDKRNGWGRNGSYNPYSFAGKISITRDGGETWSELSTPFGTDIASARVDASSKVTIVGSSGYIAQTFDDGKTWQTRKAGASYNHFRSVYSRDGKIFWAVGSVSALFRSDDGGVNWVEVSLVGQASVNDNLNDIQFSDSRHGWIVGDKGLVLATEDGGKTWQRQKSGTNRDLRKVQFVDTRTGWIVGDYGVLLATGTGGF